MSAEQPTAILRFSLGGTAIQVAAGFTLIAGAAYLAFAFAFQFADVPEHARRAQPFWDFLRSNDGRTGAIIWGAMGLLFAWPTLQAARRFLFDGPAAALMSRTLLLHSTYGGSVAREGVQSVVIRNAVGALPIKTLVVKVSGQGPIKIHSNTIKGGVSALTTFAARLEEWRSQSSCA